MKMCYYTIQRLMTKREFVIITGAKYHLDDVVVIGEISCVVSAKAECKHKGYYKYILKES